MVRFEEEKKAGFFQRGVSDISDTESALLVKTQQKGLFFCHALSINLLKYYHHHLLLDCTYKTNKYKMPLLHIAGITGSNKTFILAFCFIAQETKP